MKPRMTVISTALLLASGLAFAGTGGMGQSAQRSGDNNGQPTGMSGMTGCGMTMEQETNLHQHMQMMRSQMSEIMQTTDPVKRQALMQDQMDSMDRMLQNMENIHGQHAMMSNGAAMHGQHAMMSQDAMMHGNKGAQDSGSN
jgi:hypothetical protein